MGYVMAGLLSGLGQGMQLMGQQQHEAAIEALRNQRQIEQEGRAEARDDRKSARETSEKIGLLGLAQQYKQAEGETEFQYKVRLEKIEAEKEASQIAQRGKIDANLAVLKARLDQANDVESQKLKAAIAAEERAGKFVRSDVDTNGRLIATFEDGHQVATPFTAREEKSSGVGAPSAKFKRGPTPKSFDPNAPEQTSNPQKNSTWWNVGTVVAKPKTGEVRDGYMFKGGDPADPKNWVKK